VIFFFENQRSDSDNSVCFKPVTTLIRTGQIALSHEHFNISVPNKNNVAASTWTSDLGVSIGRVLGRGVSAVDRVAGVANVANNF
jgi:hypothetical protein